MILDTLCKQTCDKNPNMLVPWYLMAAYAYYEQDDPILSDNLFDTMSKRMYSEWESIEHFHKHLITRMDLLAGTYLGKYPERVKGAVEQLRTTKGK